MASNMRMDRNAIEAAARVFDPGAFGEHLGAFEPSDARRALAISTATRALQAAARAPHRRVDRAKPKILSDTRIL
jgi:hypothetical protein